MTIHKYILNEKGEPIIEPDLLKWAQWFGQDRSRIVKQEWIGKSKVSTVFLGLDHNFCSDGPPIFWECMVFDGPMQGECMRCGGSREQAEAMHEKMVKMVKAKR